MTADGDYYVTLKSFVGCDSVRHLNITFGPSYLTVIDTVVCAKTFRFRNRTLVESGVYYDSLTTITGCDSVIQLNLTLGIKVVDTKMSVCEGDSVYIRNRLIPAKGIYYDTLVASNGCDSIVRYIFNVHPTYDVYDTARICAGDAYYFFGRRITESGDYTLSDKTKDNCDSIHHLHLIANPTYYTEIDTILNVPYFRFNNRTYTSSGVYYDTLSTVNGCDSIFKLSITLRYPSPLTEISVNVCQKDSFLINGRYIHTSSVIYDTLLNAGGCDSVVMYVVNFTPTYQFYDTASICDHETYLFHGERVTASGDYVKTFKTIAGCDSVYYLHIVSHPTYLFVTDTIVCGQGVRFHERDYTKSGIYDDTLRTVFGCDSIYRLKLVIDTAKVTDVQVDVCHGDSAYIAGVLLPATGIYCDTFVSHTGCDSIVRYIFNVHNTFEIYEVAAICANDTFNFHGQPVVAEGDYTRVFQTAYGCDSIYHLHLTIAPSYLFVIDTAVCGYTCRFNGRDYTESGIYDDSLRTTLGCDSIYRLRLTLSPPQINDFYIDVCQDMTVTIRGKEIPAVGEYRDTVILANGCFSIDRYIFNVHPFIEIYDTAHLCQGDSILFCGSMIGSPGDYIVRDTTVHGCDSVNHLHVIVHESYYIEKDTAICEGDPFFIDNIQYRIPGSYVRNYKTRYGCDSTVVYNLFVHDTTHYDYFDTICEDDQYKFRGKTYSKTGIYADTVFSQYGCYIIHTLFLTVAPKYDIKKQMDVCFNELPFLWEGNTVNSAGLYKANYKTHLGCDSLLTLDVMVTPPSEIYDSVYNCSQGNYIWRNRLITLPGDYSDTVHTSSGCDSIAHLHYDTLPLIRYENVTICKGDSYYFRGNTYHIAGVYNIIAPSSSINCDTTYRLILNVDTSAGFTERSVVLCNATGYMFAGRFLTESGVYYDSVLNTSGCMNITKLNLTLGHDVLVERYFEICNGSSVAYGDTSFATSSVFLDTLISSTGCDSIIKVVISVLPSFIIDYKPLVVCGPNDSAYFNGKWYKAGIYYFSDSLTTDPCPTHYRLVVNDMSWRSDTTVVICASEVPFVHPHTGKKYYTSGSYDVTYPTTVYGCDSTYHLDLTVNPELRHDTFDTICQGDTYSFNGNYYSSDILVVDTLISSAFCDSFDVLHLKVVPTQDTTVVAICQGENYIWPVNNLSYMASGFYYYTDTLSSSSCPMHHVLSLTVIPSVIVDRVDVAYACANDSLFYVNATILPGSTPRTVRVFYDQVGHDAGFIDVVDSFVGRTFPLPMPPIYQRATEPLYYVRPGLYNLRIQFDNSVCNPYLSEATAVLEVRYPSFILEQNWNDVVAVTRYNHHDKNGFDDSYTFSKYEWFVDGAPVAGANKSYLYKENMNLAGHVVHARLTRTGENTGVFTCPLTIVAMQETGEYPVINGPANMLRQYNPVTSFSATEGGIYTVYSISGHVLSSGKFEADDDVNISLPSIPGYYILHVKTEHLTENYKILVY